MAPSVLTTAFDRQHPEIAMSHFTLDVTQMLQRIESPPIMAIAATKTPTTRATVQRVSLATVRSDARLIAGPANNTAAATPAGAPVASSVAATGISKNVGRTTGTARSEAKTTNPAAPNGRELSVSSGKRCANHRDSTTPATITGTP